MTIRSHIGYVRLVKKIIGGFWESYKVKSWFSKEVEKCIPKYIYLNEYQSLMTGSRSAIFCMYLLMIYKKTDLKGILPQCYININKFCFKQHVFFHIFLPLFKILFWPLVTSNNLRCFFFTKRTYPIWLLMVIWVYLQKIYFLGCVANVLPLVTFRYL